MTTVLADLGPKADFPRAGDLELMTPPEMQRICHPDGSPRCAPPYMLAWELIAGIAATRKPEMLVSCTNLTQMRTAYEMAKREDGMVRWYKLPRQ